MAIFWSKEEDMRRRILEISDLKIELSEEISNRKEIHNQLQDLKGNIRVFCRVRPISISEM